MEGGGADGHALGFEVHAECKYRKSNVVVLELSQSYFVKGDINEIQSKKYFLLSSVFKRSFFFSTKSSESIISLLRSNFLK